MKTAAPSVRFWGKVEKTDGCWLWSAGTTPGGYGLFWANGTNHLAHRFAYELVIGPIPAGLHLDHLCRTRNCVNPAHLEPVTPGENIRRGEPANRTRCPRGHEYTPDNTRVYRGTRNCRACARAASAAYRARRVGDGSTRVTAAYPDGRWHPQPFTPERAL